MPNWIDFCEKKIEKIAVYTLFLLYHAWNHGLTFAAADSVVPTMPGVVTVTASGMAGGCVIVAMPEKHDYNF